MRKLIITGLMLATALPGVAQAQTAREVREDARDLRNARQDQREARRYGDRDDRRDARRDVQDARRDYREELRDYRQRNRQGAYQGPRGYRYAPVNVCGSLNRSLYARNYYVANPTRYRLPPVARNQQWVRHGNDVLLVDIRNGRVLDVNRNFFW